MSDADTKLERREPDPVDPTNVGPPVAKVSKPRIAIVPLVITLAATALAIVMGTLMWDAYMAAPWTRDATVRTYVVTKAPEIAGRIVQLPVKDNQFVHKGDLLLVIDPTDYKNAVQLAEANVEQARANALNAQLELQRRQKQDDISMWQKLCPWPIGQRSFMMLWTETKSNHSSCTRQTRFDTSPVVHKLRATKFLAS